MLYINITVRMNSENNILELYIRVSNWAQVLNANKNLFVFTQKKEKKSSFEV